MQRRIYFAPFGRHTRFMLSAYLRHVLMVMAVLLAIALTIDLWPQFQTVASHDGATGAAAVWNLIRFAILRIPGLIAPLVPFATFLGVLWTEIAHTQSGERMLVWNSGRSPIDCLAPVALLGIVLGLGGFVLDGVWLPASMRVQMEEKLGLDGVRLTRERVRADSWIALPDGLLRADIAFKPELSLHRLTYFRHDGSGRLIEVVMAQSARRIDGQHWRLSAGKYWRAPKADDAPQQVNLGDSGVEPMTPFASRDIAIKADPDWLKMFGIETKYLPLRILAPLARSEFIPQDAGEYSTRLNMLYGGILLPGAMALLAATLSMLALAYAVGAVRVVGIVFSGYMAHFATKALLLLGMKDAVSPILAGWLVPLGLIAAGAFLLWRAEHRHRV